jgi:hypothetical protein
MVFGMRGRKAATYDRRRLIAQFIIVIIVMLLHRSCQMFRRQSLVPGLRPGPEELTVPTFSKQPRFGVGRSRYNHGAPDWDLPKPFFSSFASCSNCFSFS